MAEGSSEAEEWTTQAPDGTLMLRYERLPVGRYVGGKYPRTSRCPSCGNTALRNQHHFVHISEITLNAKNEPVARSVAYCPTPAVLSDAQRRAMQALKNGQNVEVDKSTWESLEKRGIVTRPGRQDRALTRHGELLLEEEW